MRRQPTVDLLALAYHELRSPLGLVATAARSAAAEANDADLQQRCEVIVRAAERLLRTASEVLTLTEAPREAERCVFRPGEVISAFVDDLQRLSVPVVFSTTAEGANASVRGVRAQFEALLQSIVSNALDHGASGTPISFCVSLSGGQVVIGVRNAVGSEKRHDGQGLGRYVCEQLTKQLGASLRYGTLGRSEFVVEVRLPAA